MLFSAVLLLLARFFWCWLVGWWLVCVCVGVCVRGECESRRSRPHTRHAPTHSFTRSPTQLLTQTLCCLMSCAGVCAVRFGFLRVWPLVVGCSLTHDLLTHAQTHARSFALGCSRVRAARRVARTLRPTTFSGEPYKLRVRGLCLSVCERETERDLACVYVCVSQLADFTELYFRFFSCPGACCLSQTDNTPCPRRLAVAAVGI